MLALAFDLPLIMFEEVDLRELGVPGGDPASVVYGEPGIGGNCTFNPFACDLERLPEPF